MKVLIDANLVISFLLKGPDSSDSIRIIFELVLDDRVELVLPQDMLTEVQSKVVAKDSLRNRIDPAEVEFLIEQLNQVATLIPPLSGEIPMVTRDLKDDYLIAAALIGDVDVLISGDKDLLALREYLDRPRIITPADFVAEFGSQAQ